MSDEEQQAFPDGLLNQDGMTLRDYFAAKAMQAMETRNASGTDYSRAIHAYEMADAMMKAREA